ncbi:MAG: DUF362 domain-containing protein [Candidatus Diapherotrites archaeon]|jgi:uncharacterized protein|uniref:DUF362 domain-containing protein n=1 Tax=Candidatus Iainarchaeum sp. TaxID=3101447 RepID=A0A8T5GG40_9ARCH|nr:DUF362 domain-containing protein [Candidatus Diapherotrites archaeon]MBT7241633.1 DUF362 domain-containing protein [Candidatus Diapherotrites archaeon]
MEKPIVYLAKINSYQKTKKINEMSKKLLKKVDPGFSGSIPLKVHFGEKGNVTYIKPENYEGIISYLAENNCEPFFTDTNVLYRGERMTRDKHIKLAKEHGFTMIPIKIADGDHGEEREFVEINKKHFQKCKIGKLIANTNQMLVIAHFKGHILAGFGGAIKQLAMGCASRGGKLDMHANSKPFINPIACKKCNTCVENCPTDACIISKIPHIDKKKCVGCATCIAVCPHAAVKINWASTRPKTFYEKLDEYALAAQKGKNVAYINFAFNITPRCDCAGEVMETIAKDVGILASNDPVALDAACLDIIRKEENKKLFRGDHALEYAEEIGLGKREYILEEICED